MIAPAGDYGVSKVTTRALGRDRGQDMSGARGDQKRSTGSRMQGEMKGRRGKSAEGTYQSAPGIIALSHRGRIAVPSGG